jgi:hypothetical protein
MAIDSRSVGRPTDGSTGGKIVAISQQVLQIFASSADLLAAFTRLVESFDAHDVNALENGPLLGEHVILNTLSPPNIIRGKRDVLNYLAARFKDDPSISFTPLTINISYPTATVSGCGLWVDKDTGTKGERIRYSFTFLLVDGNWLAENLWGAEGGC